MFASFADQTVIVRRAVQVKDHGTLVADWSQPWTDTPVEDCSFQPQLLLRNTEDITHRAAVKGLAQLLMPPGTDITGLDRVVVDGDIYEVEGKPGKWHSPSGNLDFTHVILQEWEG